ncbi:MAG: sulfotransferase [Verrucomicrobia bacterium]|nr:sulfotransferase [Verrucomicrobiota bacterium]
MNPDKITQKALKKHKFTPDEMEAVVQALNVLCPSMENEAHLTTLGRWVANKDLVRMVNNYVQVHKSHSRLEVSNRSEVQSPMFIIGMPRTGSSLLHNLLAVDRRWRAPVYWETLYPCPPCPPDKPDKARLLAARADFSLFKMLAPGYRKIYMYGSRQAAECIAIMAMACMSPRFTFTYHIPTYQEWLSRQGMDKGYQFHRVFLQLLQSESPGREWLLKAPAHLLHLDAMLRVYPNCRVIFNHRHPTEVIPSIASNTWHLRSAFSRNVSKIQTGQEELNRWKQGWNVASALRGSTSLPIEQFIDLPYHQFMNDPLRAVESIYEHFNMELTQETRQCMIQFLSANRPNKFGRHAYTSEEFGLNPGILQEQFKDYIHMFDLSPSTA